MSRFAVDSTGVGPALAATAAALFSVCSGCGGTAASYSEVVAEQPAGKVVAGAAPADAAKPSAPAKPTPRPKPEPKPAVPAREFPVPSVEVAPDRYGFYTKRAAAEGVSRVETVSATFFGGGGDEIFVAGGVQPGGEVIAVGRSAGRFVRVPGVAVRVWGRDRRQPGPVEVPEGKKRTPGRVVPSDHRAVAGFVLRYSAGLSEVLAVSRFGAGVASFTDALVDSIGSGDAEGAVYVAGRCDASSLRAATGGAKVFGASPAAATGAPEGYGAAFVARLAPDIRAIEWVHILGGEVERDPRIFGRAAGGLLVEAGGVKLVRTGGAEITDAPFEVERGGVSLDTRTRRVAFDAGRGAVAVLDAEGRELARLWDYADELDSNLKRPWVRGLCFAPDGDIVIAAQTNGLDPVYLRSPGNVEAEAPALLKGFMEAPWGVPAWRVSWLLRIGGESYGLRRGTLWCTYVPMDVETFGEDVNHANTLHVDSVACLADGSVAAAGSCATGLIETPDAWHRYPGKGRYGGGFVSVFTADLAGLRFSSYVPGCEDLRVVASAGKLLVMSAARESDGREPAAGPPVVKARQAAHGGGEYDGHVILIDATAAPGKGGALGAPSPSAAEARPAKPGPVLLDIRRGGTWMMGDVALDGDAVLRELRKAAASDPDLAVILSAERDAEYDEILRALDICRRAGARNVTFAAGREPSWGDCGSCGGCGR